MMIVMIRTAAVIISGMMLDFFFSPPYYFMISLAALVLTEMTAYMCATIIKNLDYSRIKNTRYARLIANTAIQFGNNVVLQTCATICFWMLATLEVPHFNSILVVATIVYNISHVYNAIQLIKFQDYINHLK